VTAPILVAALGVLVAYAGVVLAAALVVGFLPALAGGMVVGGCATVALANALIPKPKRTWADR